MWRDCLGQMDNLSRRLASGGPYCNCGGFPSGLGRRFGFFDANAGGADQDSARFDNEVGARDVTEEASRGLQDNGVCFGNSSDAFAGDFGVAHSKIILPIEALTCRDDEFAGFECAFEVGGGMDFQRILGVEFSEEFALDDDVGGGGLGIENVAALLDHE